MLCNLHDLLTDVQSSDSSNDSRENFCLQKKQIFLKFLASCNVSKINMEPMTIQFSDAVGKVQVW